MFSIIRCSRYGEASHTQRQIRSLPRGKPCKSGSRAKHPLQLTSATHRLGLLGLLRAELLPKNEHGNEKKIKVRQDEGSSQRSAEPKEIDVFGVGACCHRLVGPIMCASSNCPANWWNIVSTPLPVLQSCMLQQSCGHLMQDSRISENLQTVGVGYNGDSKTLMRKKIRKSFQ